MSQSETDKIKAAIGDYRQFKFKFIQFVKNFEEFLAEEKLLEIKLIKSKKPKPDNFQMRWASGRFP